MPDKVNASVSVVVVTCGKENYLSSCLASLIAQSHSPDEVVVIDNSLCQGLSNRIKEEYPEVKLYVSKANLFYSSSLNKGIEVSKGEFILCLNDDVSLDKDFIHEALKGFWNDNIGIVSGKILRKDKKTLDSTGLFLSFCRTPKERGYGLPDSRQFQKDGFVFGASGCSALYRRKMLEDIKEGKDYFDSDLRMFYEDLDISWRAKRYGWSSYYKPQAVAYHARGGSFRPKKGLNKSFAIRFLSDQLLGELIKNRYIVMIKNESLYRMLLYIFPVIIYDFCLWAYILLFRRKVIKIFMLHSRYFPLALEKRKKLSRTLATRSCLPRA